MSHERSMTFEQDLMFFNIPTVVKGKRVKGDEAIRLFNTGKLKSLGGPFKTKEEAVTAARRKSEELGTRGRPSPVGGFARDRKKRNRS